ncbi:hypothetical protein CCACVL1_10008 [Corchorus capsularis]|uniref:FAF domain-containing protein n=1 Tax=Corchorus capsularis TaxID=210143 RepID=A0A1R3IT68_COCAP|nr:hypothetical protein CCACVL1_10008 [Corchorus capsularis]
MSGSFSRFPAAITPMQIQKQCSTTPSPASYNIEHLLLPAGLKTLIFTPQTQTPTTLIIHSCTIPKTRSPSSPDFQSLFRTLSTHSSSYSSCSSGMDDMLGTESGVYMSPNELQVPETESSSGNGKRKQQRGSAMTRQFPPTIPLLARTGNLPGHMPWILTRHYKNGRLVLKEEKVKHHEYFEAHRENGRLILQLVPLDDTVKCHHTVYEEINGDEELELEENIGFCQGEELDKVFDEEIDETGDDDYDEEEEEEKGSITISSAFSVPKFCHGNERFGDPRKCLTYSGRFISESSSMFRNGGAGEQQEGTSDPLAFCNIVPSDVACLVNA